MEMTADVKTSTPPLEAHVLAGKIRRKARELGFDLVGIASAEPSRYRDYLRQWLDDGQAGTMEYLTQRFEERADPAQYFPDAKSVVCVAVNYHARLDPVAATPSGARGRIARYALGDDYHQIIKDRLHDLADWLRDAVPEARTRCAVDTAPVMEKELAARAGVGWIGKNTLVIHPDIGSWLLLGEMLTTLELPVDEPAINRCGTCTRCLDACPTAAITAPYELDARKCISYLTIEHRQDIADELHAPIGDWVYGCDICQEVCPWNRKAPLVIDPALQPRFPTGSIDVDEVLTWTPADYTHKLRHSAMKRVKLPVLQRNALIVRNNADAEICKTS
jgi:epoxyqueuosine reductase